VILCGLFEKVVRLCYQTWNSSEGCGNLCEGCDTADLEWEAL
jgi:hypothetical protein